VLDKQAQEQETLSKQLTDRALATGPQPAHWETGPDGKQVWVAASDGGIAAPQVDSSGNNVYSDPQAAAQTTAAKVQGVGQIGGPTISSTTIAPAAQITAAQVAPTAGATAGQVTAAQLNTDPQAQFRQGQQDLVSQLQSAAKGDVPSAAEIQGRQQMDQAAQQQLALVGMNHGRGAGAALRTAGRTIAGLDQTAAGQAAQLRAGEMATARGQLGTALDAARGTDVSLASKQADLTQGAGTTNAQLTTTTNISNADRAAAAAMKDADLKQAASTGNAAAINELNQRQATLDAATKTQNAANALDVSKTNQATDLAKGLADAASANTVGISNTTEANKVAMTNAQQDLQGQLANQDNATKVALANAGFTLQGRTIDDARNVNAVNEALKAQLQSADTTEKQQGIQLALNQFNVAVQQGNWDNAIKVVGAVLGATSSVGAAAVAAPTASDRRLKRNIKNVPADAVERLAKSLDPKSWHYRGKLDDGREHHGFMAQDLEKDPLGKKFVVEDDEGIKGVDYQGLNSMLLAHAIRGRRNLRPGPGDDRPRKPSKGGGGSLSDQLAAAAAAR
jgi:hypothetical protein